MEEAVEEAAVRAGCDDTFTTDTHAARPSDHLTRHVRCIQRIRHVDYFLTYLKQDSQATCALVP